MRMDETTNWRQGARSLGGAGRAPALAGETSRETMSVKVLTATCGRSNWKSLASGGPTVDESLLLTLGDGSPVGRNHSCPGHSCLPLIRLLDKSAGSWRSRACGWQVRQDSASWGRGWGGMESSGVEIRGMEPARSFFISNGI